MPFEQDPADFTSDEIESHKYDKVFDEFYIEKFPEAQNITRFWRGHSLQKQGMDAVVELPDRFIVMDEKIRKAWTLNANGENIQDERKRESFTIETETVVPDGMVGYGNQGFLEKEAPVDYSLFYVPEIDEIYFFRYDWLKETWEKHKVEWMQTYLSGIWINRPKRDGDFIIDHKTGKQVGWDTKFYYIPADVLCRAYQELAIDFRRKVC